VPFCSPMEVVACLVDPNPIVGVVEGDVELHAEVAAKPLDVCEVVDDELEFVEKVTEVETVKDSVDQGCDYTHKLQG
jgi:hypothetical protein